MLNSSPHVPSLGCHVWTDPGTGHHLEVGSLGSLCILQVAESTPVSPSHGEVGKELAVRVGDAVGLTGHGCLHPLQHVDMFANTDVLVHQEAGAGGVTPTYD